MGSGWETKKGGEKSEKKVFIYWHCDGIFCYLSSVVAAPEGTQISNELQLTVTVQDIEGATIAVNPDLALTSAVGLYDCFTVSTTPGDHEGKMVRGKLKATPATGFKLEYVEQDSENPNYKKYLPLPVEDGVAWFGPGTGFPLAHVTDSMLRVTWNKKAHIILHYEYNGWRRF